MKADPDGYTILFSPPESWVGYYYGGVYDVKPTEQLVPIASIVAEPYTMLEVLADSPYKTWVDFVKWGKNKGKATCATGGYGGLGWLLIQDVAKVTGFNLQPVPFTGSGPTKVGLLGGHVDMRTCQPSEAIEMVRAGRTRALAVTSENRIPSFPDTPTFKELGIGGVLEMTRSFWGPPNLPSNIVNKLTKAIEKAAQDPKFIKTAQDEFLYRVEFRTPEKMKASLKLFDDEWGPKWRQALKK